MRISDWSSDVCSSDLNIMISLLILMVALQASKPLDFSAFPTVLLLATLFRLALNVASTRDRKSVVEGKSVSVRVDLGGRRIIKKKKTETDRVGNDVQINEDNIFVKYMQYTTYT